MGRKAKIKKQRQGKLNSPEKKEIEPQNFVKDFQHRGYSFDKIKRSPEVPADKNEPQI